MKPYAYILRGIAEQTGLKSVKQLAIMPGMKAVFRVTIYYADMRAVSAVATMTQNGSGAKLDVVYQGRFENNPLVYQITETDYANFVSQLNRIRFDRLPDQDNIPLYSADLCLVERGANSFVHGVIFAPQYAEGIYAELIGISRQYLSAVFREIK